MINTQNKEFKMTEKEKEIEKTVLTLRQLGTLPDTLTYEVIETSCARFACKEVFSRRKAIKLCDEHDVTIVFEEKDQKISGFNS